MTNGDDVIVAVARGVPIKMVGAEMQRDPQGILFHAEHPLHDLKDLQGKTLMAGAGFEPGFKWCKRNSESNSTSFHTREI